MTRRVFVEEAKAWLWGILASPASEKTLQAADAVALLHILLLIMTYVQPDTWSFAAPAALIGLIFNIRWAVRIFSRRLRGNLDKVFPPVGRHRHVAAEEAYLVDESALPIYTHWWRAYRGIVVSLVFAPTVMFFATQPHAMQVAP